MVDAEEGQLNAGEIDEEEEEEEGEGDNAAQRGRRSVMEERLRGG